MTQVCGKFWDTQYILEKRRNTLAFISITISLGYQLICLCEQDFLDIQYMWTLNAGIANNYNLFLDTFF